METTRRSDIVPSVARADVGLVWSYGMNVSSGVDSLLFPPQFTLAMRIRWSLIFSAPTRQTCFQSRQEVMEGGDYFIMRKLLLLSWLVAVPPALAQAPVPTPVVLSDADWKELPPRTTMPSPIYISETLTPDSFSSPYIGPATAYRPSEEPSEVPSEIPSEVPSDVPSNLSSDVPSQAQSDLQSDVPSDTPSHVPSVVPSDFPSLMPSAFPTTTAPLRADDKGSSSGRVVATTGLLWAAFVLLF